MLKEIEAVRAKLQKKIADREQKLNGLMDMCRERWDVNWYGYEKYQDEYNKRSAKLEKELKQLKKEYDRDLTPEEQAQFCKGVDHALYSQVNTEMMQTIVDIFNK